MRQKILLSAALLHDPDILILDEPFSGLDVTTALMLRSLLRGLAARGKMILYSSHVLEVVEKVCSDVLILRKGEVVAYDSIDRLRELMSQPSLEGVFAQLTEVEDSDSLAGQVLDAMSSGSARRLFASLNRNPASPMMARVMTQATGLPITRPKVGRMCGTGCVCCAARRASPRWRCSRSRWASALPRRLSAS